ncbi:aspartate--tRNA ligase, mitochondrial isoform X2 [Macrobrachium rosenbergii]|uniref:aspartate--tRNA ligase, mitochondrial isoform X2 n=1 Tax=Macrobrachium rosenbergii TaxID=79674 RepID=UPI0034D3DE9A
MRNSLLQLVCLAKHLQNQIRVGPLLPKPVSPLLWRTIHGHRPKYGQTVGFTLKTHTCGELTAHNVGETVTLRGFLQYQRMGKFAVLRDSAGQTQIILREENTEMSKLLNQTPFESYVEVKGVVQQRPEDQYNKNMLTGEIEILAHRYEVLSKVQRDLPFIIRSYNKPKENLRLQYRYLDLRHEELQRNLKLRSMGAQEFVVPSRHPGKFYSLVQSPQTYKQLAMIGGFERYFQFAICYRDEGGKPDRQPEFMQVDLEVANVTMEEIQRLIENLLAYSWPSHLSPVQTPFPVVTYQEAMSKYGVDKPDTRFDWKLEDVSDEIRHCGAAILEKAMCAEGSSAHAFLIPDGQAAVTKKIISSWESLAKREFNLNGPSVMYVKDNYELQGNLAKFINLTTQRNLIEGLSGQKGDILVMAAGPTNSALSLLGKLRLLAADIMEAAGKQVRSNGSFNFLWVVDFPLFEFDDKLGKIVSLHHPFTLPKEGDAHLLYTDPLQAKSQHYDLVLNGSEIGGGSIRVHDPVMQRHIVEDILKLDAQSLKFFNEALASGTPPHGGIALGFDRLMEKICGGKSIRDVIAFPKSMEGRCLMSGAPGMITKEEEQLYHISIKHT